MLSKRPKNFPKNQSYPKICEKLLYLGPWATILYKEGILFAKQSINTAHVHAPLLPSL
jgi:hypothetical protein